METTKTSKEESHMWEDVRKTVRGGIREIRHVGDELARQGRLRMDICQTERRLKSACEELGRAAHAHLAENRPLSAEDPAISELTVRIGYYQGELKRLHDELQQSTGGSN